MSVKLCCFQLGWAQARPIWWNLNLLQSEARNTNSWELYHHANTIQKALSHWLLAVVSPELVCLQAWFFSSSGHTVSHPVASHIPLLSLLLLLLLSLYLRRPQLTSVVLKQSYVIYGSWERMICFPIKKCFPLLNFWEKKLFLIL